MKGGVKIGKKGRMKASLTVEAAIIIPFIFFTVTGGIQIGYRLFQEAKDAAEVREQLEQFNPVEIVRKNTLIATTHGL